jgi:hypothetical protein
VSSPERVYSLLVQANPIPDPQAVPSVPSPALLDERRSEMLTQEPTETRQIAPRSRWPRAAVAFAATIVIVGAAVGIWALTNDPSPVAAADAQIEVTLTGDEAVYAGDREIVEGTADVTWFNESDELGWFVLMRFDTGSAALDTELARAAEGGDFVTTEDPIGELVIMDQVLPAGSFAGELTRTVSFEPGTYILDAGIDDGNATHVYRAAVIEVVAAE